MTVNFYLKRNEGPDRETAIVAYVRFKGRLVKVSTGISIAPKQWNAKLQRPKRGVTGEKGVNDRLQHVESALRTEYSRLLNLREPITAKGLREGLDGSATLRQDRDFFTDYEAFNEELKSTLRPGTVAIHKTVLEHVRAFAKTYALSISYDTWNLIAFDKFVRYLTTVQQLNNQTVWKVVRTLRVFLKHAVDHSWSQSKDYEKFTQRKIPKGDSSEKVYITTAELKAIRALDLSGNERLATTRDLLLFQCGTGLRWADVQTIRPEHVHHAIDSKGKQQKELQLVTGKNRKSIRIPLLPMVAEILERYEGKLPARSNQKQNDYIKELARKADIDRPIVVTTFRGTERIEKTEEKCKLLGTHSCKRTFVSLLRENGTTVETICRITGNSRATIERYILKDENDSREEMEALTAFQ